MSTKHPLIAHVDAERGFSGGEVQVFLLMESLRDRFDQVLVVPPGSDAARIGRERGFPVRPVSMRADGDLLSVIRLVGVFRDVDLVHLHTGRAAWLGGLAAWWSGRPAIVTRRMDRRVRKGLRTRLVYHRFTARTVAISPAVRRCLVDGGVDPARIDLVPDALDETRIVARAGRSATRRDLDAGDDRFVVLALAQLMRRKGIDLLIEAVASVADPTIVVWVAGAGPELANLQALAAARGLGDRVRFLGRREDPGDLLAACDLFVLPSRQEGLGVAALEALAAARPVLATRVGGLGEVVVDGRCGVLVPPEDVPALASALRALRRDPALRSRLAKAGPLRVDEGFRVQHMRDGYERIYRSVLEQNAMPAASAEPAAAVAGAAAAPDPRPTPVAGGFALHRDCRHVRWDRPCAPHKQRGKQCGSCDEYDRIQHRVLMVKLAATGDVLRTTAFLPAIHATWPGARVTWVTRPAAAGLFANNPLVDEVLTTDDATTTARLLTEQFDAVLCPDADPDAAVLASLAKAKEHRGYRRNQDGRIEALGAGAAAWFAMGLSDALKRSNQRTYQSLVAEVLGLDPAAVREPILEPSRDEIAAAAAFRASCGHAGPWIGLNTGAGGRWAYKQWTLEHQQTFLRLATDAGLGVLLLGGPEEVERHRQLLAAMPGRPVFDGGNRNSYGRFAALLQLCQVVVTSDSLAVHVAAARKVPAVVLFGPTSAAEIELYGRGSKITPPGMDCLCCYLPRCDVKPHCQARIEPQVVLAAVQRWLVPAASPAGPRP